ncbi:MAG: dihydrofolate reductase, partial [Oscillospiraceae bacterium]|nr:dihydrofolate reductase [Oscillospiraceae bacterium]
MAKARGSAHDKGGGDAASRRFHRVAVQVKDHMSGHPMGFAGSEGQVFQDLDGGGIGLRGCFVIGGGSIYRQLLPYCDAAYITKVHVTPESDTFFPNLD